MHSIVFLRPERWERAHEFAGEPKRNRPLLNLVHAEELRKKPPGGYSQIKASQSNNSTEQLFDQPHDTTVASMAR